MTRILESQGRNIPVLVDSKGDRLYIELRTFDEHGERSGAVYAFLGKGDARKMAEGIIAWLEGKE